MIFESVDQRIPRDIHSYVEGSWLYRAGRSEAACVERTPADDCSSLVVEMAAGHAPRVIVCGPEPTFRQVTASPGSVAVGMRLRPGTVADLFGVPGRDVAGRAVSLDDLLPRRYRAITDSLSGDPEQALDVVFAFLQAQARMPPRRWRLDRVRAAMTLLSSTNPAPLASVAYQLNTSERSLRRDFGTVVGLGPKLFARVLRFRRAARRLTAVSGLSELAMDSGFADQAHMTREFAALIGVTPRDLQNSRMTFVPRPEATRAST